MEICNIPIIPILAPSMGRASPYNAYMYYGDEMRQSSIWAPCLARS
jgi:hypothetical protein